MLCLVNISIDIAPTVNMQGYVLTYLMQIHNNTTSGRVTHAILQTGFNTSAPYGRQKM